MGTVVGKEQCPVCAKEGRDRHGDNLARYSDDSAYCFSCGFHTRKNKIHSITKRTASPETTCILPPDCTRELPTEVRYYLYNKTLTDHEIKLHNIMWSNNLKRIVFPLVIHDVLKGWIARSMDPKTIPKVYSRGQLSDFCYIIGNKKGNKICIVEDIISAICVARGHEIAVMPLFGAHLSTKKMLHLGQNYGKLIVWLDKDKQKESSRLVKMANDFSIDARTVITNKDPKEYNDNEIKNILAK